MRPFLPLIVLIAASTPRISAQEPVTYNYRPSREVMDWGQLRGDRVRVSDVRAGDAASREGVLLRSSGDTLFLDIEGTDAPVPVVVAGGVEVEQWRRSDSSKDLAVLGAILGSIAGGVIAHNVNDAPPPRQCRDSFDNATSAVMCGIGAGIATSLERSVDRAAAVAAGVLVGGLVGAVGGRLIGRSMVHEGWRPVRRAVVIVAPARNGQWRFGVQLPH